MKRTLILLLTACICACQPAEHRGAHGPVKPKEPVQPQGDGIATYMLCDFDTIAPEVKPVNSTFEEAANPVKDEVNPSERVGKTVLTGGTWDCVQVSPTHPLDFTKDPAIFRVKVLAPAKGRDVYMQMKTPATTPEGIPAKVMVSVKTQSAGKWEELEFDFRGENPAPNWYTELYILFDGNTKQPGAVWYFDDVRIPDDDLSSLSLFKRHGDGLLMDADKKKSWMSNSIANPDVLTPDESPDGNWWLFTRGGDGSRGSLGIFTQPASRFNPLGPWTYYEGNPIVPYGWYGTADNRLAIDPAPVVGTDGKVYLFYKGTSTSGANTVLLGVSDDGYTYTKTSKPWKEDCGVADVVLWKGKYYMFVSRRGYKFSNPLSGDDAEMYETVAKGDGPAYSDHYSINGQKILRLADKWFMIYQSSPMNADFPDRFHVAYSDDLEHWTKVKNEQPLFTRGARGTWDQGAIWAPATFEYNGSLYMYYEGWGQVGTVKNRDKSYFTPAHSAIGLATCKVDDFLKWCGLK
ncbi:MAG: hypothetical protein IJS07_05055 [Bacteroidales bacterium]|nr:hypothetical protein [Bacteroidales bacterium]